MPEIITGQDAAASYEASGGAEEAAKVDAARAALVDEATGETAEPSELILGKYKSTDDLAEAYQNLQREYSRLKANAPATTDPAAPANNEEPEAPPPAEGDTPPPGADEATVQRIQQSIFQQAGGEAEYQRLATWAANNLPAERTNAYNAALAAADEGAIMNALKGLQYDYMMKNGYEPRLTGGRAPSNEIRGFESEAQVVAAMKDSRYMGDNPDPAYIKEVERRIAVSNVFQTR